MIPQARRNSRLSALTAWCQKSRDGLLIIRLVSVGMLFDPTILLRQPLLVGATLLIIVVGNAAAATAIALTFRRSLRVALTLGASLSQIGEFSFILAGLGIELKLLPETGRGAKPPTYAQAESFSKWTHNRTRGHIPKRAWRCGQCESQESRNLPASIWLVSLYASDNSWAFRRLPRSATAFALASALVLSNLGTRSGCRRFQSARVVAPRPIVERGSVSSLPITRVVVDRGVGHKLGRYIAGARPRD
jgi:Kef-type K+ transport system membrane component KefB